MISLDLCHAFVTLAHMKIVMDADCLIKLTKAQIKEDACAAFEVAIPAKVRKEVMMNASSHPECSVVQRNLDSGALQEVAKLRRPAKGEDAVLAVYQGGGYAAVASDDKRFIRKLKVLGVPFITPAVLVLLMVKQQHIGIDEGFATLDRLSCMVSDDETAVVKLKLETLREGA